MKILAIHNDYQVPGGETAIYWADGKILQNAGHNVVSYFRDNREIRNYGLLKKAAFFPNAIFSGQSYSDIRRLVKEERPDIAHVHNVFPLISPSVYRALQSEGIPIVQTLHNFRFLCPNGFLFREGQICERCKFGNTLPAAYFKCYHGSFALSLLYAASIGLHRRLGTFDLIDRFIANTDFMTAKIVEARFSQPDRIAVLGNNMQHPLPEPLFAKPADGYIAYFGRLSEEKGVADVIKAIQPVEGVTLKIAGDGPDRENLQQLAKDRQLDRVEFVGRVTGEEKWNFLRNARCTVMSSRWYENFPISVLESMVVGTPVIGSSLGSIPYILKDCDNGLIYNPRIPLDLTDKIRWLLDSPEKAVRIARRARETVETDYTSIVYCQKLITIYDSVLQEQVKKSR